MGGLDLLIPILFIVPTSLLASAFLLLPTSSSTLIRHGGVPTISPCAIYSSVTSISSDISTSKPTTHKHFFEKQLDVCKQIIAEHQTLQQFYENGDVQNNTRTRFKEHPRCTARFGEVLQHARNRAISINEYENAVQNARSIVNYVDAWRHESDNIYSIREGLIADIAVMLTSHSIRKFRVKQIEDAKDESPLDFTLEDADLEILGRLYYSAISRNERYLQEVGLTVDHGGFTALLALCRASADSSSTLSEDGARLDAALSNHFNGITVPGCRLYFSHQHGIYDQTKHRVKRSKRLIVAFSSLGNGLVRHEFLGSLAKINNQLHSDGKDDDIFDVLFVADPSQSWYQKDSSGKFDGFTEYEQRIRVASRPYEKVSCIGDSMGGSGALLFAHLSTESAVAFSPQIDLDADVHVSRYDMIPSIRDRYSTRLLHSVEEAVVRGVNIFVHRGVEETDTRHTDLLVNHFSGKETSSLQIIEHADCHHHQVAMYLKQKGQLAKVLLSNLI